MFVLSPKQLRFAAHVYCVENDLPPLVSVLEWVERETLRSGIARLVI